MAKFEVKGVHHLGFIVKDVDETVRMWESMLGIKGEIRNEDKEQIRYGSLVIKGVRLSFTQSTSSEPNNRYTKFLEKHGDGLEHIALEVSDIEEACQKAKALNLDVRFEEHKLMETCKLNFIEKEKLHGTILELREPNR
jgi:methylmalonyl-CoA/ethylmalonyl-CoA epimerase